MIVMIPESVNVKDLVSGLNLSATRSESIKNKIYYFLSLLVLTNDNYSLNEKNNGYRNISSVKMRKVMGRKDYYLILQILSDSSDPVIESDGSWRSAKHGGIAYCIGYCLCQKYNTGEVVYKTIPEKIQNRINKHIKNDSISNFDDGKYRFLYNQFDINKLSFDPTVYDYIQSFGRSLLSKVHNGNQYQMNMVLNLIGRWLDYVERIVKNDLWYQVSPANYRLNSSLTHLKKTLRPFLLCNGNKLGEIDISASQPYILSSVMSNSFITGIEGSFNLRSLYPEVFDSLNSSGYINSTGIENSNSFGCTSYSGSSMHTDFNLDTDSSTGNIQNPFSFMWGQLFNDIELNSIIDYQASPFDNDFYKYLISRSAVINNDGKGNESVLRQKMKDSIKLVLFDNDRRHRDNNAYMKIFREIFPGVDKWICYFHSLIGNSEFSYLLQRAESYLVLDGVSKNFNEKYPSAPIFTIHDAICTYPEYLPDLKGLMIEYSQKITGTPVGLQQSIWEPSPIPSPEDLDHEWKKIKPINSLKKYQDKAHSVFSSNIDRASKFL
jgi:hypothetical protein